MYCAEVNERSPVVCTIDQLIYPQCSNTVSVLRSDPVHRGATNQTRQRELHVLRSDPELGRFTANSLPLI